MTNKLAFIATQLHGAAASEPLERHIDFVRFEESGKPFMVQVILSTVSSAHPSVELTFCQDSAEVDQLVAKLVTHDGIRSIKVFEWNLGINLVQDVLAERADAFNKEFERAMQSTWVR